MSGIFRKPAARWQLITAISSTLLIHDGDFISTQTVSSAHQILYNDAHFPPWVHPKLQDKTYDGNSAWFTCTVGIPNQQTAGTFFGLPGSRVHNIYAGICSILLTSMRR
ncbi:hypothetical protein ACNKHT_16635 [Shigella flexneri]